MLRSDNATNESLVDKSSMETNPSGAPAFSQRALAFFALVFLSVTTQTAFKVSQRGGKYEYNTISAMSVVEFIKLLMSLFQHYRASSQDISACRESFQQVPKRLYRAYFLLALSYAVYNQIIFAVMGVADPGTFSLFKSFTPILVSLMNWCVTGQSLSQLQWYCVVIQVLGIIPVIVSNNGENGSSRLEYSTSEVLLMLFAIVMGSLNSVYNATVIKKESTPVAVQNTMLYSFGVTINLAFYSLLSPTDKHFFDGYGHFGVLLLLTLNSFVGIAITMLYKYGDAVLKSLTQPLSSSILVFISYLAFGMSLDVVKAAGAGVVVVVTLLYFRLPPPSSAGSMESKGERPCFAKMISLLILLCISVSANIIIQTENARASTEVVHLRNSTFTSHPPLLNATRVDEAVNVSRSAIQDDGNTD